MVKIIFGPDSGGPMFEPQHSPPRPKGEEGIWNVFVTKVDFGPYKPLDGFNMAAIRNKITEFYSARNQLLFRLRGFSARIDKRLEQINTTCPNRK